MATALAATLFVAAGPSSDAESTRQFRPPPGPWFQWVDGGYVARWAETGGDREHALDVLALKYLRDYTRDEAVAGDIAGIYWCGTPVLEQLHSGQLPPRELTEAALRRRAQSLVATSLGF
jgi:hypothetical protein